MTALTERDARTRWCPFARVAIYAGSGGATANRHPSDGSASSISPPAIEEETRCIGSKCMAWRWHSSAPDFDDFPRKSKAWPVWNTEGDVSFADAAQAAVPDRPADVPANWEEVLFTGDDWYDADGGEWIEPEESARARHQAACDARTGFCGLAGGVANG